MALSLLLALAAAAAPSNYKPADPGPAPVSIESKEGEPKFYLVEVEGRAQWRNPKTFPSNLLRRVEPILPPYQLLRRIDPAIATRLANKEQPRLYARIEVDVSTSGKGAACRPNPNDGERQDAALIDAICPVVLRRASFRPALDMSGKRVADSYAFSIFFTHRSGEGTRPPLAIKEVQQYPATEMPPANLFWPDSWPVESWMLRYREPPIFAKSVYAGISEGVVAKDEPIIEIAIGIGKDRLPQCEALKGQRDEISGKAVCSRVMAEWMPAWDNRAGYWLSSYPLLAVGESATFRIIGPAKKETQYRPVLAAPSAAQTLALVRAAVPTKAALDRLILWLEIGPDGRVTECRIGATSRTDAWDIAACKAMREQAVLIPGYDAFGRPLPSSDIGWTAEYAREVMGGK